MNLKRKPAKKSSRYIGHSGITKKLILLHDALKLILLNDALKDSIIESKIIPTKTPTIK